MEEARALMYRAMIAQVRWAESTATSEASLSRERRTPAPGPPPQPRLTPSLALFQGKYAVVKGDVKADDPSGLQAVKNLARFMHTKRERYGCRPSRAFLRCLVFFFFFFCRASLPASPPFL